MIKSVNSSGRYIQIGAGIPMGAYFSPGAQGAGQMRFNTNSNNVEVWDGVAWKEISNNHVSVGLTGEAESLLDWARVKRDEDIKFKSLMESHPGIQDLKEKLDIMVSLVKQESTTKA